MKLSKIAILALRGCGKEVKEKIATVTGLTWQTVYRLISDNGANSDLTKAAVVKIISEETGLSDQDILEDTDGKDTPSIAPTQSVAS